MAAVKSSRGTRPPPPLPLGRRRTPRSWTWSPPRPSPIHGRLAAAVFHFSIFGFLGYCLLGRLASCAFTFLQVRRGIDLVYGGGSSIGLMGMISRTVLHDFINPDCRQILVSAPTASELLTKMELYHARYRDEASLSLTNRLERLMSSFAWSTDVIRKMKQQVLGGILLHQLSFVAMSKIYYELVLILSLFVRHRSMKAKAAVLLFCWSSGTDRQETKRKAHFVTMSERTRIRL